MDRNEEFLLFHDRSDDKQGGQNGQQSEHVSVGYLQSRKQMDWSFEPVSYFNNSWAASSSPQLLETGNAGSITWTDISPDVLPISEEQQSTVTDAIIDPTGGGVNPESLLNSLPEKYKDAFKRCPMSPLKRQDLVNYLLHIATPDRDESVDKELLARLGTRVPTQEGDRKKWKCEVLGCAYRGTLQHLLSHLRHSHIRITTFSCAYCPISFYTPHDRDRHLERKICRKSHLVKQEAWINQDSRAEQAGLHRLRTGSVSRSSVDSEGSLMKPIPQPLSESAFPPPEDTPYGLHTSGWDSSRAFRSQSPGSILSTAIDGGKQTPLCADMMGWAFLVVRSLKGAPEVSSIFELLYLIAILVNGITAILSERRESSWSACISSLKSHKVLIAAMEARLAHQLSKHTRMEHREFVSYVETLHGIASAVAKQTEGSTNQLPRQEFHLDRTFARLVHVIADSNIRELTELLHGSGLVLIEPHNHEMATNFSPSMIPVKELSDGEQWYHAERPHVERSKPVFEEFDSVSEAPSSPSQPGIGSWAHADHPRHSRTIAGQIGNETIVLKEAMGRHRSFVEQVRLEYQQRNGPANYTVSTARIGDGPREYKPFLPSPDPLEGLMGTFDEATGRKGRHHVQLVPLNFELPETYTWVDEDTTYSEIGLLVYTLKSTALPVALEQKDGPYPRWQIPDRAAKIPRHLYQVYIADVTNPFTIALVRNPEGDTPILISIPSTTQDKPPTVRDVFGPALIEQGVQWNAMTLLWDPHDIQRSPYHLIQQDIGGFYDTHIMVLCNGDSSAYKFGSVLQVPVPLPLKVAFLRCRALVKCAPRLKTLSLPTIHLCRALLHLIFSVAKAMALPNLHVGLATFFISRLESLVETMQAILAGLADVRYQSEGFSGLKKIALSAFFYNMCSELPGVVTVRRSFDSFTVMMNYRHQRRISTEADPYLDDLMGTCLNYDDEMGALSESDEDNAATETPTPRVVISGFRSPSESPLSSSDGGDDYIFPPLGPPPVAAAGFRPYFNIHHESPVIGVSSEDDMEVDPSVEQPLAPTDTGPYTGDFEVLYWTSTDPGSSFLLDIGLKVIYRYTTEVESPECNKVTLWRYVSRSRKEPVARFKRSFNGSFGDAIIGEVPGNVSDFLRPKEGTLSPWTQCLYHNERWYEWDFPGGGECILRDTGGNPVAILCAVQPERCPLGTVYSELRFSSHIAMVTVSLKDAICISAMLYRCFIQWDLLSRVDTVPVTA